MTTARTIVTAHVDAALAEAEEAKVAKDTIARILFEKALNIWRDERELEDIASELTAAIDNLNPDEDYTFMRP